MTTLKTIYGDATVQQMAADEDGDVGYRVVVVASGAVVSSTMWVRDAAESELARLHSHYVTESAAPHPDTRAAAYLSGDERSVGAGPESR